jgi:uncharacterized protein
LGVFIITFTLIPLLFAGNNRKFFTPLQKMMHKVKYRIATLIGNTGASNLLLLGILNGLLPCGLVYLAFAGSLAVGNALKGSVFMMGFGLGTLPALIGVSYAGQFIRSEWRSKARKAVPYFVLLMGLLLVLRGMNIGIPFSPKFNNSLPYGAAIICHP